MLADASLPSLKHPIPEARKQAYTWTSDYCSHIKSYRIVALA